MVGTLEFIVALCAVLMSMSHCEPAHLHPPTNLMFKWVDPLTVNVSWSWERPKGLPQDCEAKFELNKSKLLHNTETHFLENLLTEDSAEWVYKIQTLVGTSSSCKDWKSSMIATIDVKTPKPRAEVKDFKCYLSKSGMDCSWIPNSSSPLSLSYRECGHTPTLLGNFKTCNVSYNSEMKGVCLLKGDILQKKLCMVANTSSSLSTFKVKKAVRVPKMKISENKTELKLTMMPLEVEIEKRCLLFNICYSVCNKPRPCLEYSVDKGYETIPYDKSCQYKFQYILQKNAYCTEIKSDWSDEIEYGSTDETLTVVAIVIPIIVSACVILSCICFRRHKDIICPDIPDPSTIFKEMINDNKEIRTKISTYTPVQEPIERITIVPDIPQNL